MVDSFSRIVRLGEGLSRTGRLDDRAMDRAYDALALCAERVARKGLDAERLTAVATQACRAADNGEAFIERVRRGTGLKLKIIDPAEEASLSVAGCLNLFDPKAEAVLVIDVGGGSTELSWLMRGARGFESKGWMSAPMGVVTLAERHPEPVGNTEAWYEAMVADVSAVLAAGGPNDDRVRGLFENGRVHMVGTSGAITSLAGIHLGLRRYQRDLVDGLWMTRGDCEAAALRLKRLGPAGRAPPSWKRCSAPGRASGCASPTGACVRACCCKGCARTVRSPADAVVGAATTARLAVRRRAPALRPPEPAGRCRRPRSPPPWPDAPPRPGS
ncbi:Guanosine-5'-triphosphate,3'-diphosphate pyrophosphatase [compost metagenome]